MVAENLRPLIGDSFWSKGETFDVFEPATGAVIARVPDVGREGVEAAVAAAKSAFGGWASTPPKDRAAALLAFTDEIMARVEEFAELEARDVGKPLEKARAEITDGEMGRYAAEIAEHKRDPYSLVEKIVSRVAGET